jgi:ABC-type multidrug transport system fused ATPase/permease subunit
MTAATCLVLALLVDPILALQCLLLPAALLGWLAIRDRAARNRHLLAVDDLAQLTDQQIHESFSQVRLACGYSTDSLAQDRLDASLADAGQLATGRDSRHVLGRAIRGSLAAIATAVILALVSRRMLDTPPQDSLTLPSALILLVSIAGLLRALDRRGELQRIAEQAGRAAERIHEYLDRVPPVSQAVGASFLQPLADEIRFESVTWQTDDGTQAPSLKGLDLVIPAGETTALLSIDPREARAVAWLLARFIDPHGGRVVIDGQDIATGTLESLRAEVLVVAGDGDCFSGSVLDNICCGRPEGGLSRATEAAKEVHAHHFISKLPNGYETKLGSDGVRLDAGQAYRIGLARALARNPALLVIEEPATPMDADTKSLLDDTYDRITTGRTVIFLPSRLSTVRRADRVVLVHDGQVAETGRHEDLVRTSELYRHWEYTRFNAFGTHTLPSPAGH